MSSSPYKEIRAYLKSIGVDTLILEKMDSMQDLEQQEIAELFKEITTDEILYVISLKDIDFFKEYVENKNTNNYLN
ncbi:hypothetical protein [Psychrobacillus sp. FSL H8-0487]|uniref:hypothetical protein n=1 Tax=Psychrobacillus sp. FSL H8-0487 TaxID=2921391 RepID=UPI0030F6F125